MKTKWSATDRGYIDEIISALKVLGKDKMICYADEINWLKQLRKRTEEDYKQQVRIQAAIAAMLGQLCNDKSIEQMIEVSFNAADKTKAYMSLVVRSSVMLADALIDELKGGEK